MGLCPGVDRADLPCAWQRVLGAIASLGRTDLLAQEHILLLTRPRLQELSAGSPGPVTSKATKVGSSRGAEERVRPGLGSPTPVPSGLSQPFPAVPGRPWPLLRDSWRP